MTTIACPRCHGCLWVCVDHPLEAWDEGCRMDGCEAEGMACICNPDADMPPGFTVIASVDEPKPN